MNDPNKQKRPSFQVYRQYCQQIEKSLNEIQNYTSKYHISPNKFLKQHDGEYLEIVTKIMSQKYLLKINLLYSLAYSIPLFYFMAYDIEDNKALTAEQMYINIMKKYTSEIVLSNQETVLNNQQKIQREMLHPHNESSGIFLIQNHINKEYFYTLHHCEINMKIQLLIPMYLSFLGLHPPLIIYHDTYQEKQEGSNLIKEIIKPTIQSIQVQLDK